MKTLTKSLCYALLISAVTFTTTVSASASGPKKPHRIAAYQVGAYGSLDGTKLNVAIDKEQGGRVDVSLKNEKGTLLFHQTLKNSDEKFRAKLDVSELAAGTYQLEVSNGKETTVRNLTIVDQKPTEVVRTISLL